MTTQAYFEEIEAQLLRELDRAQETILVAVAWFTNAHLFSKLCEKIGRGVIVELIVLDDDINSGSAIDLQQLKRIGGKLYQVAQDEKGSIMHNKFCVIDRSTVINGSYNWSYKARQNHENITVSRNAPELVEQFTMEFKRLKAKYFKEEDSSTNTLDIGLIIKRLSLIKQLVELDELADVPLHLSKLPQSLADTDLSKIIEALRLKQYSNALVQIQHYVQRYSQVAAYSDPEIAGLQIEAKALELQLLALEVERTELERLLRQFHIRHTQELGALIIRLLELQAKQAATKAARDEAEADREEYEKDYIERKDEVVQLLTEDEKSKLKQLYREASKLCHPDMVAAEYQHEAGKWFVALKDAYEHNDIARVQEVLTRLQNGTAFGSMIETLSELVRLRAWVSEYRVRVVDLVSEIVAIKDSEEYQTIISISDWDGYFAELRQKLQSELESYGEAIENIPEK